VKSQFFISPKVIFVTFGEINFLFGVIEITFGETLWIQNYSLSLQQTKPVHLRTGRVKNIDGIEAIKPFVRLASKGRFQNVIFFRLNFAT